MTGKYPMDKARLEAVALRYVERYATSRQKLVRYLERKLREQGWSGEGAPPVAAIADRFVTLRYIDDGEYARMRLRSMQRRGYGVRRIDQALAADGVEEVLRDEVTRDVDALEAAVILARRRRIGPYGAQPVTPEMRQKAIGILMRAGHSHEISRRVATAISPDELEDGAG